MTKRASYLAVIVAAFGFGILVSLWPKRHVEDAVNPQPVAWEPWHRQAWAEVAACVGNPRAFPRRVTLYRVDSLGDYWGAWYPPKRAVYIRADKLTDTALLKHEFVHILEARSTHGPMFREWERCGFTPHFGLIDR